MAKESTFSYRGSTALITGASGGLGQAFAEQLAAAADVVTVGVVHDLNLAARFADHIVLLNEAQIVANGTAAEVLTTERIQDVFGVKPTFIQSEGSGVYLIFN